MSSHSHQDEHRSLTGFAAALGEHLPGRWQAGPATSLVSQEAGSHRIWHSGPLAYTAFDAADAQRCVLTSPYGLQLYVLPRPHRAVQFLVLPMLPAGCQQEHIKGLPGPHGIAVPADPVRAAATVRRRMLLEYRFAALPALRAASPGHLHVQVSFGTERRPRIRTTYIRALTELLARDGFLLDAACRTPSPTSRPAASSSRASNASGVWASRYPYRPASHSAPPRPSPPRGRTCRRGRADEPSPRRLRGCPCSTSSSPYTT